MTFLQYLLLVLLSLVIVLSIRAVGVALVLAMLVTPASAAYLLTRRLPTMMVLGAFIGVTSAVMGLLLSFYLDIASGPAIVLIETAIFALVFIFAPRRGVLGTRVRAHEKGVSS